MAFFLKSGSVRRVRAGLVARSVLFGAAALIFLSGCCRCRSLQRKFGKPLKQTQWQLVQLDGLDRQPAEGLYTIVFTKNGRLEGTAGCNRMQADYEAERNGRLRIGPVAATRMACDDATEGLFLRAVQEAVRYELDARMLILSDSSGVRAVFQAVGS